MTKKELNTLWAEKVATGYVAEYQFIESDNDVVVTSIHKIVSEGKSGTYYQTKKIVLPSKFMSVKDAGLKNILSSNNGVINKNEYELDNVESITKSEVRDLIKTTCDTYPEFKLDQSFTKRNMIKVMNLDSDNAEDATPTPKFKHGDIVLYDLTPMRVETVEFKEHHLGRNNVLVYTTTNLVTNRERGDWTEDNFVGPINVPALRIVPLMKHAQKLRSLNFDLKVINRNIVDNRPENKATAQQRFNQKRDEYKQERLKNKTNLQPSPVSVVNFDITRIHTDVKRFQNRQNEYSEESKNRIVKAYKDGEFDFAKFDPITIWLDKKQDKYFVLSGHSRLAAFRELSKIDKTFANIPARIFDGTEAAAIDLALNSNVLSTKESDMERAIYYHNQRNQCEISNHVSGLGRVVNCAQITEDKCREQEGKNAPYILSLSYLNPDGFLADSMKRIGADKGSDDANIIRTIAGWVGDIRKRFPDVSDAQETEIAKYLINGGYGSKSTQFKNKEKFILRFQYAFDKWQKRGANPSESLNLANSISKSTFEKEYDERLAKAEQLYQEAKADYEQKHNKYWLAVTTGKITLDKMNELEKPLVDYVNKCLDEKKRIMGQKEDVKKANAAQYTLWGVRRRGRYCRKC